MSLLWLALGGAAGYWWCRRGPAISNLLSARTHALGGLLTDDCEQVEVDTYDLPPGEASVFATAAWMSEIIARGASHPVVRLHAENAVAGVDPTDYRGQIRAIERYLDGRYRYVRDPEPVEYLQTPWWLLACGAEKRRPISGDCDDAVMLSLSMLAAVGFPWRLELVSQPPADPGELNHVRGAVELPSGEWVPVDLTARGRRRMPEYRVEVVEAAA